MKNLCTKFYSKVQTYTGNERGSQALEWIGVAAVIITIVTLLSTAVSANGDGVSGMVGSIFDKISSMMN
ncbi:hypothetical protein AS034_21105 [[Bacillus] enclensis]|uniref:Pilus assembly protein Flp/PilA n=1 Tax=[Bacillus] enclensis TaxID=1402860 RepID=A0A0V8H5A5_9BACI|nr:hypothetical protein [[Bacillus] enclensis]KSU57611.1 hypothetical protein AS034_21105 [[Bacillus] enclensis]SCC37002.1 hypothetical protein GA0061094_4372 [[Bacillus] enclensis]